MCVSSVINELKLYGQKGHGELYLDADRIPHTRPKAFWLTRLIRWLIGSKDEISAAAEVIRYLGEKHKVLKGQDVRDICKRIEPVTEGLAIPLKNLLIGLINSNRPKFMPRLGEYPAHKKLIEVEHHLYHRSPITEACFFTRTPYPNSTKFQREALAPDFSIAGQKVHKTVFADISQVVRESEKNELSAVQSFTPGIGKMIDFAYTGQIQIADPEEALQLIYYAEKLQASELYRIAFRQLRVFLKKQSLNHISPELLDCGSLQIPYLLRVLAEKGEIKGDLQSEILAKPFPIPEPVGYVEPLDFRKEHSSSDYQIQVGKRVFYAHKAVLASRNDYFSTYFCGGDSKGESFIEFQKIEEQHMEWVLDYIYTKSQPSFEKAADAESFLMWIDYFQFPELKDACFSLIYQKRIGNNQTINLANIGAFLETTGTYGASQWNQIALNDLITFSQANRKQLGLSQLIRLNELLQKASRQGNVQASDEMVLVNEQITAMTA